jgi:hypothetical protein
MSVPLGTFKIEITLGGTTMAIHSVTNSNDVHELVNGLLDASRREPWVVVSVPLNSATPLFSPQRIQEEAGDVTQIWVLRTGDLSRDLAAKLPERTEAYGGAARVYPPGNAWSLNPSQTKIRFIHNDSQIDAMTENLIADIHSMAYLAGLFRAVVSTRPRVAGEVKGFTANGSRAWVKLDNREVVTASQELTFPDVPLEWVIYEGQTVEGYKDSTLGRFHLDVIPVSASKILTWYPDGAVTWALVQAVDRKRATLAIHPGLPIVMEKAELSSNPRDRVDLFLIVGDIVPVRVVRGPQGDVRLRMNDIDDDEPVLPSQPLVAGGLPWLTEDRALWSPQEELTVTPIEDFLTSIGLGLDLGRSSEAPALAETLAETLPKTPGEPELVPAAVAPARPTPGRTVSVTTGPIALPGTTPITAPIATVEPTAADFYPVLGLKPGVALQQATLANAALKANNASLTATIAALEKQVKAAGTAQALDKLDSQRFAVSELAREKDTALEQLKLTRDQLRESKKMVRHAQESALTGPLYSANRVRFAQTSQGADEWARHEITLAWIDRFGPEDRARYCLPTSFALGPKFTASLETLDNGHKNKALKAVVDVLTGYAVEIDARNVHPLREGDGATAADVTRGDGARCFRAYIEQNSPAARRLHYWQHRDNTIELSRVVTHDVMVP